METLSQDLRYAVRMLVKNPGFTLIVVLILAFGIGANSSMFTLINGVLLDALPYKDSDRLVAIKEDRPAQKEQDYMVSGPEFTAWTEQNSILEHSAAITYESLNLSGAEPESLLATKVSSGFLSVLGVAPQIGRFFFPEEDLPGASPVVLLSNRLWQRRFGSDPGLIGNSITLSDKSYTVIGVMPNGFEFPPPPPGMSGPDLWVPIAAPLRQLAGLHNLYVVGRLKPRVSIKQAQSDIGGIAAGLERQFPESNTGHGVRVVPLREQLVGDVKLALLILAGAVGFVLMIACANVANLLLCRAASRQKEMSIRMALGASRMRLIRQLLTESLALGLLGGGAGLVLAFWVVGLIPAISPVDLPSAERIAIDLRVAGVTFALSLLAGALSGIAPAIRGASSTLNEGLKDGTRISAALGRRPITSILVVAEVALALVLLIGAGLMIKSFALLAAVNAGFNPDKVLAVDLSLPQARYPEPIRQRAFFERLSGLVRSLPGVQAVGATNCLPLSGADDHVPFSIEGLADPVSGDELRAGFRVIDPDYFSALEVPLLAGRFFSWTDARVAVPLIRWFPGQPNPVGSDERQAAPCAIINSAMARRYWSGEDPVGHRIRILFSPWLTIVGVVGDIKHSGLDSDALPEIYLCDLQEPRAGMTMVIKTASGDPGSMTGAIREQVQSIDKDQPLSRVATMGSVFSDSIGKRRFNAMLLAAFGLLALALAAVGIFGVIKYSVQQRAHELGVRMALGARTGNVVRLILAEGLMLALVGIGLGVCGSIALTRLIAGLLYSVSPQDPSTFILVSIMLLAISLLASYLPARKATKVDPVEALRWE